MSKKEVIQKTGKWLVVSLIFIMALRITTYFMISESAAVTQAFKTGLRVILTGVCILLCQKLSSPRDPVRFEYRNILPLFFYLMYLMLGIASLMWTSDVADSGLQIVMDIECVVFVWYYWKVVLLLNTKAAFGARAPMSRILWVATLIVLMVFTVGVWIFPDTFYRETHGGEVARLGGFIINPNELGMLIVVATAAVYMDIRERGKASFWLVFAWIDFLYCLLLTGSRSSLISFFLATFYFVLISGNRKMIVATFVAGIAAAPVVFMTIFVKQGDVEEVMNMTGRIPFWQDLLTYNFPRRALFGYGFMRIDELDKFDSLHSYAGAMTHNTFIQVLLNLGLMGVFTVFTQMWMTFRAMFREMRIHANLFHLCLGMFIPLFVNSLTEFGIWGETNYGIMFYLLIIFMLVLHARRGKVHLTPAQT